MASPIAVLHSPLFRDHEAPHSHPECPERLPAAEAGLAEALAILATPVVNIDPRAATRTELERVHDAAYLDELQHIRDRAGHLDADTFFSPGSLSAAEHAAGGAAALVDRLLAGDASLGVGLLRPPGHHATRSTGMGFCLLNNIAVAAAHALHQGAERVLIVDWDVHHGNGTQDIFYEDGRVLFFSTHQSPWYPGTGSHAEVGQDEGRGFTVNVPLSSGAGDAVYGAIWERLLLPLVNQFSPSLILVSAGYDAHSRDPLAHMRLSSAGFGALAQRLAAGAGSRCPIALFLEGGYDLVALRESVAASVLGLVAGHGSGAPNDAVEAVQGPHAREIEAARQAQLPFWRL